MKIVILGATSLGVATARKLVEARADVVMVDRSREAIDAVADGLDCGFIQGDGTLPSVLRNAAGDGADALLALTNHDEDNVLASLVGRSVGYRRVIPKVVNAELGPICVELELGDAIFADETISERLVETMKGESVENELSVAEGVRLVRVRVAESQSGTVGDLKLPNSARVVVAHRDGEARMADGSTEIEEGDGLTILVTDEDATALRDLFGDGSGG